VIEMLSRTTSYWEEVKKKPGWSVVNAISSTPERTSAKVTPAGSIGWKVTGSSSPYPPQPAGSVVEVGSAMVTEYVFQTELLLSEIVSKRYQTLVHGYPPWAVSKSRSSTSHGRGVGFPMKLSWLTMMSTDSVTSPSLV
jgi:hypothetical protein